MKTSFSNLRLGIIGAGRFGRAFVEGVMKAQIFQANQIWASARSDENISKIKSLGVTALKDFSAEISRTHIFLLSVKPIQIESVIETLRASKLSEDSLIISVAAGTPIHKISNGLKTKNPIIRAMPNSPCAISQGMTAICAGENASREHLNDAKRIFSALGGCLEIQETHFDLMTALSGSGPAYFYLMMETMIEAAVKAGISIEDATALVAQTAKGAAMMVQESNRSPKSLKQDVATPGGCTMEALKVLEAKNFSNIFSEAIEVAREVASRLGQK